MDKTHRDIIRRLRVYFVKNLCNIESILDHLMAERIITEDYRQIILSKGILSDQIRDLLDLLVRCGPQAYAKFKAALVETNQESIAEEMSKMENSDVPTISPFLPHTENPRQIMIPDKKNTKSVTALQPYQVTSDPHGYALIINIENYTSVSGFEVRKGSSQDVGRLKSIFEDLLYSVAILSDLDDEQLLKATSEFAAKSEHKLVDAAILVILSHGVENNIAAVNGHLVNIDHLIGCFVNPRCPHLAGKPKLFVIQACRGDARDLLAPSSASRQAGDMSDFTPIPPTDVALNSNSWLSLPYMSDCVIVYTTLPGFVSWRSELDGSWYIQVFVEVLRQYGHELHVLELLTEVNRRLVEESKTYKMKQISQPVSTLTKPFFL